MHLHLLTRGWLLASERGHVMCLSCSELLSPKPIYMYTWNFLVNVNHLKYETLHILITPQHFLQSLPCSGFVRTGHDALQKSPLQWRLTWCMHFIQNSLFLMMHTITIKHAYKPYDSFLTNLTIWNNLLIPIKSLESRHGAYNHFQKCSPSFQLKFRK